MSEAIWHFIDSTGAQVGPVSAEALREALRLHSASPSSLAWREGMVDWKPIASLAAELGLPAEAPASPAMPPPVSSNNPYQAPSQDWVGLEFRREGEVVPAGFMRRLAALFLDRIILVIPLVGLMFVFVLGSMGNRDYGAGVAVVQVVVGLGYFLVAPLYYALMESSAGQATLGKRALGIKVTDMNGRRISFGHALGRWFAAALSYLTLYIGFLMAAFTDRKRALHDFVAGTQVVDRWAYTANPERQKRELSGCLIAAMVVFIGMLVVVPILAAIAISQYQDYVMRSQVSEASSLADGVKTAMGEYVSNYNKWPDSNEAAGLAAPEQIHGSYVSYVDVGANPNRIEAGFSSQAPLSANAALNGKHLLFDASIGEGSITWTCSSPDLPQKWCPSSCECLGHR